MLLRRLRKVSRHENFHMLCPRPVALEKVRWFGLPFLAHRALHDFRESMVGYPVELTRIEVGRNLSDLSGDFGVPGGGHDTSVLLWCAHETVKILCIMATLR